MASTGGPGKDRWSQPVEPSGMATWFADHRLLARVVLLAIDVAVVVLLVDNLRSSSRHWPTVVVVIAWLGLTVSYGWLLPRQVDTWRRAAEPADPR